MLWVLTGEGEMILDEIADNQISKVNEFSNRYESENRKLKTLESDVEKLNVVLKDKEKIIGLYEFMLNGNNKTGTIADTY
jgi:transcription initiation factor TFIID subunit TAF12